MRKNVLASWWMGPRVRITTTSRSIDRMRVLMWFAVHVFGTPDECSEGLQLDILRVRPRVTELTKDGLLLRTHFPRRSTGRGGTAGVCSISQGGRRAVLSSAEGWPTT